MAKKSNKETSPKKTVSKEVESTSKKDVKPSKKIKVKFTKPDFKSPQWKKGLRIAGIVLLVVLGFALIDLFVQYLNNGYSIAVVNGQRISKNEYHDRLENAYGIATANQLIEESIITQEAKVDGVTVDNSEVDTKIEEIVLSIGGQEAYEAALISSNITDEQLREQIYIDLLTTALLTPAIEYSEEDLKDFFDQYSEIMFANESALLEEGEKLNYDDYRDQVEEIYVQQEVEREKSTWLADKKDEYNIINNAEEPKKYGVFRLTSEIVRGLIDDANSNTEE